MTIESFYATNEYYVKIYRYIFQNTWSLPGEFADKTDEAGWRENLGVADYEHNAPEMVSQTHYYSYFPRRHAMRSNIGKKPNKNTHQMCMLFAGLAVVVCLLTGCTSARQWWHNGFKVGPNYSRPPAPIADQWIDSDNPEVKSEATDYSYWWTVFNDPVLNELVYTAYAQNLPLKKAGMRIAEARAQLGIARGNLFPQQQQMSGSYSRNKFSDNSYPFGQFPGNRGFDNWSVGFDAAWELDIWGRLRRGIEAADANLNAQIESYDDVLVILQGEVAAAYIQMRTLERRLDLVRQNIVIQQQALQLIERRFQGGVASELDVRQAKAILANTESLVPALQEGHRKTQNALCVLLGMPTRNLQDELGGSKLIPAAPPQVVAGIPAELLRRRPDVRRAERIAAAQSARIGIAESEFYPRFAISGEISFDAENFPDVFKRGSLAGGVGPGFHWNILNYCRIANSVRAADARFMQAVIDYQNTVLMANKEVEDGIIGFLREQQRVKLLEQAVDETERALRIGMHLYEQGVVDYQRVLDSQRDLVLQQNNLAESQGKIALNLVAVYKALGGGWRMRCAPDVALVNKADSHFQEDNLPNDLNPPAIEHLPTPLPIPNEPQHPDDSSSHEVNKRVQVQTIPSLSLKPVLPINESRLKSQVNLATTATPAAKSKSLAQSQLIMNQK